MPCFSLCRSRCPHLPLPAPPLPVKPSRTDACSTPNGARHYSALPASRDRDGSAISRSRSPLRRSSHSEPRCPSASRSPADRHPAHSRNRFVQHHRMQRMRKRSHFFERGLHDLAHLAQIRPAEIHGCRSARCSMAPIAVRIWPKSSCSSREMERNVFSCMEISCCASSLRRSDKFGHLVEHAAVVLHQVEAGKHNHHQHGGQEQVDVAKSGG